MSTPSGIVPLLKAFKDNQIGPDELLSGLDVAISQCERKKRSLSQTKIVAQDKEKWDQVIQPGLLACYDVLIGAAMEAKEYARERNEQILYNVVFLFSQVDKASAIIQQQLGLVSAETQALVNDNLSEVGQDTALVRTHLQKGNAETSISLFD